MLGACTNGTASSVDASQVLDVLKYMDTPSCASANLPVSGPGAACSKRHSCVMVV